MSDADGHPTAPTTLLTEWARLLLGSLRRAGVREVVLSPGSRSTPFVWAALREPGLRCRTVIDERSAAFHALGHARMTGRPALLICTSGSAAAHYFPAAVEASEAGVPLLVLTADRPLELQQAAAPQTMDQVKLYGDYARAYLELGTPDADPRMLRALPRLAAQAVATALGPVPGPVHINARARKPLEPLHSDAPAALDLAAAVDRLLERVPTVETPVTVGGAEGSPLAAACRRARRGLIVCGPTSPAAGAGLGEAVHELARATGFPAVAEWSSQCRFPAEGVTLLDAFPALLEVPGFVDAHAPDLILQVGRPPTASAWNAAMAAWAAAGSERYVLAPHGWPDPWSSATAVVRAPPPEVLHALAAAAADPPSHAPGRAGWREALAGANRRAWQVIEAGSRGFSEGAAVRVVVERLSDDALLAVGNSLPIRELDLFAPAGPRRPVVSQRGANGIDGLISGAAGAVAAWARPGVLLLGDVSFAHDIGGLALLRDLPVPLTVVVLNNGGGRIFERLPLADALEGVDGDDGRDPWLTPPRLDIAAAAAAYGLACARATDLASLEAGMDALRPAGGVLEVVVPPDGTTTHQQELRSRLAAELGA